MSVWTRPALPALLAPSRLSPLMKAALGAAGGLVAASAGFTVYALLAPENDGAIATQSEWKAPLPAVVELGAPKSASGDVQTLSRPIFNKDRRPTKSASAAAPTTTKIAEAPTGLAVSAIVKRGGEAQTYLTTGGGGGAWRKIGEEFEGWTVSAIEQDEVTLRNGEGSARLQLYNADPRPPDPAPPPGMPPAAQAPPALPPGPNGAPAVPNPAANPLPDPSLENAVRPSAAPNR